MTRQEMTKDFAVRLRVILAYKNIKTGELINALGITRQTVCLWKNGKALPNSEAQAALFTFLGLNAHDFWSFEI